MRIEIIKGPVASGKTTKLRAIQTKLEQKGLSPTVLCGTSYRRSTDLLRVVAQQIGRGIRIALIDDCSSAQIDAFRDWKRATDENGTFADVVIHLVKQA